MELRLLVLHLHSDIPRDSVHLLAAAWVRPLRTELPIGLRVRQEPRREDQLSYMLCRLLKL